jgi:hypothetical protein
MTDTYNVYCDESCHLEHDHQQAMVLGAVWCPLEKSREIATRLREIKKKNGLSGDFEVKWTKVSRSKQPLYLEIVDYFFDDDDLSFRALIIPDKDKLQHASVPDQDHDTWYYKMYFDMLKVIFRPDSRYRVYLDIKDTHGTEKVRKLHEVLCNNMYDFRREVIERIQLVRSHEVEQLQLADLLIGAISYVNRGLQGSAGKLKVIDRIRKRCGYDLTRSTLLREIKVNLFRWHPREFQA